jgi:hypothetical protein
VIVGKRAWWVAAALLAWSCTGSVGAPSELDPTAHAGRDGAGGSAGGDPLDGGGGPGQRGPYLASMSEARRLSRAELDHTLRDLLGDDRNTASRYLAEDLFAPYDNDYTTQLASGALIDSLERMAEDVARHVLADPTLHDRLVICTPSGPGDAQCFRRVVEDFAPRAFRRPLRDGEVDRYLTLLAFATEDNPDVDNDFDTAVELFVRAVLQDPEFLYRIEVGSADPDTGAFALTDHEIATRMSYLLWGTTPDATLLAAADAGELVEAERRRALATTMLDDPRARAQVQRFHAMWLGYRSLPHDATLTAAFSRETGALLERIVFDEPHSYLELFDFAQTFLDDALADHYGLPRPAGGQGWVTYDDGRAGLLSHGSVLSAFGKFSDTSPTQRGILVRTRLMCQHIDSPPANVNADQPPAGQMDAVCKYDRYAQHRSSGSCAACHSQMDPIGFGLENYDLAGRFREHDEGLPECVISGEGELVGVGAFSGPAELGALLVDSGIVEACVVRQLLQFGIGRALEGNEHEAAAALAAQFADADYDLTRLLVELVAGEPFAHKLEPEGGG